MTCVVDRIVKTEEKMEQRLDSIEAMLLKLWRIAEEVLPRLSSLKVGLFFKGVMFLLSIS